MTKSQQPESQLESKPRVFYVIFADSDTYVWHPFLKKNFRHVYVIERLEHQYLMLDPTRFGLNALIPSCDSDHILVDRMLALDSTISVIKVVTRGFGDDVSLRPRLMSCVSVALYIIGVHFKLCITPYQLYKRLLTRKTDNIISAREIGR